MGPGFEYREAAPPAGADLVACVWRSRTVEGEPHDLHVIPDGCIELSYRRGTGTAVFGPDTSWQRLSLDAGIERWGIRLRPAAASALRGAAPADLAGARASPTDLGLRDVPDDAPGEVWLAHTLSLLERGSSRRAADPLATHAALLLARRPELQIRDLAAMLDTSERQLRRRFTGAVGIGPAAYRRISRLHHATAAAIRTPRVSWSRVALDSGYFDQAHLINESRKLTGLTPSELVGSSAAGPSGGMDGACVSSAVAIRPI